MGLGLPQGGGGGDRTPIVKYDSRAGRIHRVDRSNASGTWETEEVEITRDFGAIMDLENIEIGWLQFPAGGAPDIQTKRLKDLPRDASGNPVLDASPSKLHRPGFRLLMKLGKTCGGNLRELASNAKVAAAGMDKLYDLYDAGRKDHPGQLPVVTLANTLAIKTSGKDASGAPQSSTNYEPVWAIARWVDRPDVLGGAGGEEKVEPPKESAKKTEPVKQPAMAEDDF